jgi:hypothetical protein
MAALRAKQPLPKAFREQNGLSMPVQNDWHGISVPDISAGSML